MKSLAAEYFNSLSPLKAAGQYGGSNRHNSPTRNGLSGRCHCCPYGYHIDLDFVRYCDMLSQGNQNDSSTLRQLKKLKRARRRQTKSMEVMLGIDATKENGIDQNQNQTQLGPSTYTLIELSKSARSPLEDINANRASPSNRDRTPPPPPPRRYKLGLSPLMSPPPDVINSMPGFKYRSNSDASFALEEAVLDFEEALESSRNSQLRKKRSGTLPASLDLLHHTPQAPATQFRCDHGSTGKYYGRSQSLPRQFADDFPPPRQRNVSNSSFSSATSISAQPSSGAFGSLGMSGFYGWMQQSQFSDSLACLPSPRGVTCNQPDTDVMSVTSAVSGISTTALQSIRDQMASSLTRLRDLEEEVKVIPMLQIKLDILKEEKLLLLQQLTSLRNGDGELLLPPSLEGDLFDFEDDVFSKRNGSRRSESPMRVNLEDFRSHRRPRASSVSDSESESVRSSHRGNGGALFIREGERVEGNQRKSSSMPRKTVRDAATTCRVLTRDVGVTHVGQRTRSVGLGTDKCPPEKCRECEGRREVKAKPCLHCFQRNARTFEHRGTSPAGNSWGIGVGGKGLSRSAVSLESFEPIERESSVDSDDSSPGSRQELLSLLGRKSSVVCRLSEPQLAPPVLTFDNSTNTEPIRELSQSTRGVNTMRESTREKGVNTKVSLECWLTHGELNNRLSQARKEWEAQGAGVRPRSASLPRTPLPRTSLECGVQVSVDDLVIKHSVGISARPVCLDVGVGAFLNKTRSVGSGDGRTTDILCTKCRTLKVVSIGIGDMLITAEEQCTKCSTRANIRTKTVGSSSDRVTDRLCDRCDNLTVRNVAVAAMPEVRICTSTASVQTRSNDVRTVSMNTLAMDIPSFPKRESSSPGLLPTGSPSDSERIAFGSSGVRVCDKCHAAIQCVAKNIVGSPGSSLAHPVVSTAGSKIPRPVTEFHSRVLGSNDSSLYQSQESSLNLSTSRPESAMSRPPAVRSRSFAEFSPPKSLKVSTAKPMTSSPSKLPTLSTSRPLSFVAAVVPVSTSGLASTESADLMMERPVSLSRQQTYIKEEDDRLAKLSKEISTPTRTSLREVKPEPEAAISSKISVREPSPVPVSTYREHPIAAIVVSSTRNSMDDSALPGKHRTISQMLEFDMPRHTRSVTKRDISPPGNEHDTSSPSSLSDEDSGDDVSVVAASSVAPSTVTLDDGGRMSKLEGESDASSVKRVQTSREMKAALKVLNDSIGKPVRSGQQLTNAVGIVQKEWFKVSSVKDADPHAVEEYLDFLEGYSKGLLLKVVNMADMNGNTALHYSVSHGSFDVVSILLDSKVCNVNLQNRAGYTCLMLVSLAQVRSEAHTSVVRRLFEMGDVNIKARQHGQTALMLAVSHGRLDMVRLLVECGADVNIRDEDGSTALMCASEHGHLAIVGFLLGLPETDPTITDNDGSTALTIAVEAGHKDVGVLLYKHMNLSRGSSPFSSVRLKRSRTPTSLLSRSSMTPPPRSSAPTSPGRSRKSSAPPSPGRSRQSSASLSNLMI